MLAKIRTQKLGTYVLVLGLSAMAHTFEMGIHGWLFQSPAPDTGVKLVARKTTNTNVDHYPP